jgi:hypothetical protein
VPRPYDSSMTYLRPLVAAHVATLRDAEAAASGAAPDVELESSISRMVEAVSRLAVSRHADAESQRAEQTEDSRISARSAPSRYRAGQHLCAHAQRDVVCCVHSCAYCTRSRRRDVRVVLALCCRRATWSIHNADTPPARTGS